jgi:hypothetical protein
VNSLLTQTEQKFQSQVRELLISPPKAKKLPDILSEEAYFYDRRNFAHLHGPGHMDVRLSQDDQKQALVTEKAMPHLSASKKGCVSCVLDSEGHVETAKELVRKTCRYCEEKE